jgi:subtilisin-like proprotein convertase family protein
MLGDDAGAIVDAAGVDSAVTDAAVDAAIPDATPPDARSDATIPDAGPPDASPGLVLEVKVTVAIDHGRLGNLTIKLTSAEGSTVALMSRPGFFEAADDGSSDGTSVEYGDDGDRSDLWSSSPITYLHSSGNDAETMGKDLYGTDTAVCASDSVCDYAPNPGAVGGPALAALANELKSGPWRLCVGDSDYETAGTLQSWSVTVVSDIATETLASGPLAATIQDDGYNGSIPSTTCHTIVVP